MIEEYDKLTCEARALFKQLIENSQTTNTSMQRCGDLQHRIEGAHAESALQDPQQLLSRACACVTVKCLD